MTMLFNLFLKVLNVTLLWRKLMMRIWGCYRWSEENEEEYEIGRSQPGEDTHSG